MTRANPAQEPIPDGAEGFRLWIGLPPGMVPNSPEAQDMADQMVEACLLIASRYGNDVEMDIQ